MILEADLTTTHLVVFQKNSRDQVRKCSNVMTPKQHISKPLSCALGVEQISKLQQNVCLHHYLWATFASNYDKNRTRALQVYFYVNVFLISLNYFNQVDIRWISKGHGTVVGPKGKLEFLATLTPLTLFVCLFIREFGLVSNPPVNAL